MCPFFVSTGKEKMSRSDSQIQDIIDWVQPTLKDQGLELYDVELSSCEDKNILQIFIDKKGGVNLDECAKVSRNLSLILDVEEPFSFEYILEVSSPGIFRRLKKDRDLEHNIGKRIKVLCVVPIETIVGELNKFDGHQIMIKTKETLMKIPRIQIGKISLFPKI